MAWNEADGFFTGATWQGVAESRRDEQARDLFISGVLLGVAGGAGILTVQKIVEFRLPVTSAEGASDPSVDTEP